MSCPDWTTLAAWRDDPRGEEPAEWREALAHLDRGCTLCRRAACAADPTLVFRRLAAPQAPQDRSAVSPQTSAQEASDVESMRRAVAAMRAASRVEAAGRRGRGLGWKHWAAAAALAVAALSLPGDDVHRLRQPPVAFAVPAVLSLGETATFLPAGIPPAGMPAGLQDDSPILEGVNLDDARLYQFENEEIAVVMVVAESLGV